MANGSLPAFLRNLRRLVARQESNHLSDRQLLRRFLTQHDDTAFAALVSRHGPLVLAIGRRVLHDSHAAEDVFQATFLVLARKAASIRKQESLSSWLYGVAYRLAVRAKAQTANRQRHEQRGKDTSPTDPAAEVAWRELGAVLDEELIRLPEKVRAPLVLCYLEGKTQDEAARQLGWAASTLRDRLGRGRELLRGRLERRGVLFSTGLLATALSQEAASAAVSAALLDTTVEAALTFGTGEVLAGALSAPAVTLAKGALQAMFVTKLKVVAVALVSVGLLGMGAGVLTHQALGEKQVAGSPAEAPKPPVRVAEKPKPAAEPQPRTDRYGDPLPDGAVARLGTLRFRHEGEARSLAFSPDGKTLAARSGNMVFLWEVRTGRRLRRFPLIPGEGVTGRLFDIGTLIAFSPDGKVLAAPADRKHVTLWDVATGEPLRSFTLTEAVQDSNEAIYTIRLSHDGKLLAVGASNDSYVFDIASGKPLHHFKENIGGLVFSPDSQSLIRQIINLPLGTNDLQVWSIRDGKVSRSQEIPAGVGHKKGASEEVTSDIAFSPDGKTMATSGTDRILLWDTADGKLRARIEAKMGQVINLAFNPDGRTLVSGSESDGKVHVWDAVTGQERRQFNAGPWVLRSMALSPDGKTVAAGGVYAAIRLWDLATGQELFTEDQEHDARVNSVAYSPDGKLLASGGENGQVSLWDTATGTAVRQFRGAGVRQLAFSPDGRRLALLTPGKYFAGKAIRIWDAATGKELLRLPPSDTVGVNAIAFSPDGKTLVSAEWKEGTNSLNVLNVSDIATGRSLRRFPLSGFRVDCLALSPNGKIAALGGASEPEKGLIRLWDLQKGQELLGLPVYSHVISALAFSPGGRLLVSGGSDQTVRLWEVLTGKEILARKEQQQEITTVAFSPDGSTFASGSGTDIRLWNATTGDEIRRWGDGSYVTSLSFSPDGSQLASGLCNSTALLWDVSPAMKRQRREVPHLGAKELEVLWTELGGADARKARLALGTLAGASQQVVSFLKEGLQPTPEPDAERIKRLIADLDSDRFARRDQAAKELEQLGELAAPAVEKALQGRGLSLEMRRRLEGLREKLTGPVTNPGRLRELRAVEVLEHVGTPEARQVLASLTKGAPEARLTQDAKSSLERLSKRAVAKHKQ